MKIRAVENFSGLISMSIGDERELEEGFLLRDLLRAGYVVEVAPVQQKKAGKKNESKSSDK